MQSIGNRAWIDQEWEFYTRKTEEGFQDFRFDTHCSIVLKPVPFGGHAGATREWSKNGKKKGTICTFMKL